MKRENYLFTIERNGEKLTVIDVHSHPLIFLAVENQLGHKTVILFSMVLTDEELDYSAKVNLK